MHNKTPIGFIPGTEPVSEHIKPAWWFVFQRDLLLVEESGDLARVPFMIDLAGLNLRPVRKLYLGTLDGQPCFVVEVNGEAVCPEGMQFRALRFLYGRLNDDIFWLSCRAFQIMYWDWTNAYCGRCGRPTEQKKKGEYVKSCPNCGLLSYPRVAPAIIVSVVKDNQILLAKPINSVTGNHSVLAGFVEPGESLEDCVIREVKEEVGIDIKNITYFGSQPWPFPSSLMIGFTAEYASGEIVKMNDEISSAGWFTPASFPPIPGKLSIARALIDWYSEKYWGKNRDGK